MTAFDGACGVQQVFIALDRRAKSIASCSESILMLFSCFICCMSDRRIFSGATTGQI